jgi:hypothetical protein
MAKARGRTERRHVREKATIDHLVQDVYEPNALIRNTLFTAPRPLPACRSRIRFARNGILARVAFPLFVDKPQITSIRTNGACATSDASRSRLRKRALAVSRCGDERRHS